MRFRFLCKPLLLQCLANVRAHVYWTNLDQTVVAGWAENLPDTELRKEISLAAKAEASLPGSVSLDLPAVVLQTAALPGLAAAVPVAVAHKDIALGAVSTPAQRITRTLHRVLLPYVAPKDRACYV